MSDKDLLADAKERFRLAEEAEADNRAEALDDLRFSRLAEQWPINVRRDRELEGRPCLTINRMPAFIKQVTNDARMNRPRIKVSPVDNGADIETAEVLDGLIRSIENSSNAEVAYDTALDYAVTCGFGYFRVDIDYAYADSFDLDIKINRINNPFSVYGDHNSQEHDASDWEYAFVTEMIPAEEFKARWKGANQSDWESDAKSNDDDWGSEDTVRVAEYWTRDKIKRRLLRLSSGIVMFEDVFAANQDLFAAAGIQVVADRETFSHKVTQRIITGSEVLETNAWKGCYIPIVPVYGDEVWIDGKRHLTSLIRHAKDPQRMFNYWRTAATELVALAPKAPFIGPSGAFDTDADKWATANVKSHPYIEFDGALMPQRQPFAGVPAGALQEAMSSADDMKSIMGLYDASLGARSNETSGRAIMARQREGDISTFNFIDNLSRAIRYAGRVIIDLIPHVYNTERVIRVMGEDGTITDTVSAPGGGNTESGRIYDLTAGKYDVTVSAGPSFTSRREEAALQMTEFIRAFPPAAQLIGDLIAKNQDWPGAEDMAKRMKAMLPPQVIQAEAGENPLPPEVAQAMQAHEQQIQQMGEALNQTQQEMQKLATENQSLKLGEQSKMLDGQIKLQELEIKRDELKLKVAELEIKRDEMLIKARESAAGIANDHRKLDMEGAKMAHDCAKDMAEAMTPDIVANTQGQ